MKDLYRYIFSKVHSGKMTEDIALDFLSDDPGGEDKQGTLHPLLHVDVSLASEHCFVSFFSGKEFFLRDHRINGVPTFPGSAFIEMVRAAVRKISERGIADDKFYGSQKNLSKYEVVFNNVVFKQALVLSDERMCVELSLHNTPSSEYEFVIRSYSQDNDVVHVVGRVSIGSKNCTALNERISIDRLKEEHSVQVDVDVCYSMFQENHIDYASTFRSLDSVCTSKTKKSSFGRIKLPETLLEDFSEYTLHPSLLDGAFQMLVTSSLSGDAESNDPMVPFSIQKLVCTSSLPKEGYVWTKELASHSPDKVKKFQINILGESGALLLRIDGFNTRLIGRGRDATVNYKTREIDKESTFYFCPVWREKTAVPMYGSSHHESRRQILFCGWNDAVVREVMSKVADVNVKNIHSSHSEVSEYAKDIATQVFSSVKSSIKSRNGLDVLIVVSKKWGEIESGMLSGMLRSVSQEHDKIRTTVLSLDSEADVSVLVDTVIDESRCLDTQVKYEKGIRKVRSLVAVDYSVQPPSGSHWKPGGTYLITGGLGGLGKIFSENVLTVAPSAKVFLVGRSPISLSGQQFVDRLNAIATESGGVIYKVCDITNPDSVQKLVGDIETDFGTLDGIIHSAGSIDDSFILSKNIESVRNVLLPKISGLVALDDATAKFKLDFFVTFSSTSALFGNVGQSDYAAANGFMDAFMLEREALVESGRRYGRSLSINWPLWNSGGMTLDKPTIQQMKEVTGLTPLTSVAGIDSFNLLLSNEASQIAVLFGGGINTKYFTQKSGVDFVELQCDRSFEDPSKNVQADKNSEVTLVRTTDYTRKLRTTLVRQVSEHLDISEALIDTDAELSEFGFDSVTVTGFANTINRKFGLDLTPTVFFEYPTIDQVCTYLLSEYHDQVDDFYSQESSTRKSDNRTAKTGAVGEDEIAVAGGKIRTKDKNESMDPNGSKVEELNTGCQHDWDNNISNAKDSAITSEPIAIIGVSGSFPGSQNLEAYWDNLWNGKDCITEVPESRWNWSELFGDPKSEVNKTNIKHAGVIPGIDEFDSWFFGISPREAEAMDPQQRLLMEYVWRAIEDSGHSPDSLSGTNTGLFIATGSSGYSSLMSKAGVPIEGFSAAGVVGSVGPNRMSYFLNLHGPSEPIETACSSSLVAIHRAVSAIRAGQCEQAIVGGVNLLVNPESHISFNKAGMLSIDGRCKTFSKNANGYVRGEGVGMMVIKPLSIAEKDRDHIYGLIRGTAENHGGRASSLTAPNPKAQANLIKEAIRNSGVRLDSINYIEAHGTGTVLGDPIEIQGLKNAFKELAEEQSCELNAGYCHIGAVKSNIGHLELAAGIAGLMKVLMQMKYKSIAPSLHCDEINPYIDLKGSPFNLVTEAKGWDVVKDENGFSLPLRAGISSFGFGGVNSHVVVEEYVDDYREPQRNTKPSVIVLSAKTREQLQSQIKQLHFHLSTTNNIDFVSLVYTLQVGRNAMECRWACVAESVDELQGILKSYIDGEDRACDIHEGDVKKYKNISSLFSEDEDLQAAISSWVAKGKLEKLCELWVTGLSWDWARLYSEPPFRLSLPTYPFAKERCWYDEPQRQNSHHIVGTLDARSGNVENNIEEDTASSSAIHSETLIFDEILELCEVLPKDNAPGIFDNAKPQTIIFTSNDEARRYFPRQKSGEYVYVDWNKAQSTEDIFSGLNLDINEPILIYYLWPIESSEYIKDFHPIWSVIRSLKSTGFPSVKITLCGESYSDIEQSYLESWFSLSASLKFVAPEYKVSVLIRDMRETSIKHAFPDYEAWGRIVVNERSDTDSQGVIYRGESRFTYILKEASLQNSTLPHENTSAGIFFKQGGAYLITGGLGGIGEVISKHLASEYQANLVLCGRSTLDEARRGQVDLLENLGAKVEYFSADVTNEAEMQRGIAKACKRFGVIDGAFHAAGATSGASIFESEYEVFRSTIETKIDGALVLDKALADQPLDFMCYFSSVSAVLGDMGSCDYALANRFLLSYAEQRESRRARNEVQGKSISIAWPLWRDGGMSIGEEKQTHMYLASSGQVALEKSDGIDLIENIVRFSLSKAIVFKGDSNRIKRFIGVMPESESTISSNAEFGVTNYDPELAFVEGENIEDKLMWSLVDVVAKVLKTEKSRIEVDVNLADFGFDSISLAMLSTALTKYFGVEITPSIFFSYSTLVDLHAYFLKKYGDAVSNKYQISNVSESAVPSSGILGDTPTPAADSAEYPVKNTSDDNSSSDEHEPIAVIGMSGRFPGARNTDELWQLLAEARCAVGEIPAERFDWREYYGDPTENEDKTNCKWLGALSGIEEFDPRFFEISPAEAEVMDPRQRLLLQEAWRALEDAAYGPRQLSSQKVGMFVGVEQGEYQQLVDKAPFTANHDGILAARLAYILNLRGPALAINTACSSGLVAAHEACVSLRAGDCDAAIAGGVHVLIQPDSLVAMGQAGMLSIDGRCHTFSEKANGMVPGEAIVAVVLKRLSDAERDGDPIHGVIRGSGINYDGKTNGITAPSGKAQSSLITEVYNKHKIPFNRIDYIIAHGTGTRLGDPIEVNALYDAFKSSEEEFKKKCALTSNKPNLGHTFAASGLVSLVSMLLSMRHEKIPASINCEKESNYISWSDSPFYINKNISSWPKSGMSRLGALSAYGICGTNAHVVLESYDSDESVISAPQDKVPHLVALSAKSEPVLRQKLKDLCVFLGDSGDDVDLGSLSFTMLTGRHHFAHRVALVVDDVRGAVHKIERFLENVSQEGVCSGKIERRFKPNPSLMSTGEKAILQYRSMIVDGQYDEKRACLILLSGLYTQGYQLHWEEIFVGSNVRRSHFPTYPFSRERYWVDLDSGGEMLGGSQDSSSINITPLVHRNISRSGGYHFVSSFSGEEFFFRDHIVNKQKVLPGVAYLEMARVAVSVVLDRDCEFIPLRIENIVILKPFVLTSNSLEAHIGLRRDGSNKFYFEVYSYGPEGRKEVFSQGNVVAGGVHPPSDFQPIDESICVIDDEVSGRQCYDLFSKMGISHGEAFRSIKRIKTIVQNKAESCLWVDVRMPVSINDTYEQFGLHPSIMDGALQSGLGFVLTNKKSGHQDELGALIPFAIDSVTIYSPVRENVSVIARTLLGVNKNIMKCDFDIVSTGGRLCARIKGYSSRRLELERKLTETAYETGDSAVGVDPAIYVNPVNSTVEEIVDVGFLQKGWSSKAIHQSSSGPGLDCSHVFLCDLDISIDVLSSNLPGASVHALRTESESVSGRYTDIASGFLSEISSILSKSASGPLLVQLVIEHNGPCLYGGLAGMLKCVEIEHPRIKTQLIVSDETRHAEKISRYILKEQYVDGVLTGKHDQEVCYLAGNRSVMSLSELKISSSPKNQCFWKNGGVYLITGGLGGLGKIFAKEMVCSDMAVHVILVGRSALDERRSVDLEELKSFCQGDTTVDYYVVDIDDEKGLCKLVNDINDSFGSITGVLHSAGVVKDNFVKAKSDLELRAVFSPKVSALEKLDNATKHEPIELFVLFSSLSSVFGNVGQSDYAAANGFMDKFAFHRNTLVKEGLRSGKTLSINWPLWESGGMQIEASELELLMRTTGILPLPTEQGVRALGAALTSSCSQVAVFAGGKKHKKPLSVSESVDSAPKAHSKVYEDKVSLESDLISLVREGITTLISEQLKVKRDDIDVYAEFSEFGFDSVSLTTFGNELSKRYRIEISPTLFFEYPCVDDFCHYLADEKTDAMRSAFYFSGDDRTTTDMCFEENVKENKGWDTSSLIDALQAVIVEKISEQLKIDRRDIDILAEFGEFGFDSVSLTSFGNTLNQEFGLEVSPTLFFEHPTIEQLSEHLVREDSGNLLRVFGKMDGAENTNACKDEPLYESFPSVKSAIQETGGSDVDLQHRIQAALIKNVCKQLKAKEEDVDPQAEFSEFGFDSVSLTAFGNTLNQNYDLDLMPTIFFEAPTIALLSEYILDNFGERIKEHLGEPLVRDIETSQRQAHIGSHQREVIAERDEEVKGGSEECSSSKWSSTDQRNTESGAIEGENVSTMGLPHTHENIAIVGVSGCFPESPDLNSFWENLSAGRDCITEVPGDRWDWDSLFGDPKTEENKTNIKHAGIMAGLSEFDPLFFGISPREAEVMDPQQRLIMTYVWKAIEDSGHSPESFSGTNTGVFIGTSGSGYGAMLSGAGIPLEGFSVAAMSGSVGPNRMSFLLNLSGPSEPIETACSSSLVAIHRAVHAIHSGQCDQAIVGGVNTLVSPELQVSFSKAGMLSPDGRCKTFSKNANGYVRGEGVGMLVLKRLSVAEMDRDNIYAVIRGSAENHGGRANSLTAPNPKAQAALISSVMKASSVDPKTVSYIEAHGTGTPLGDPIEIQGLKKAFKDASAEKDGGALPEGYCRVGSVKSNIGHLELAAGVAGVIKVLLQFKHKKIVPSLHCEDINPYVDIKNSPFKICDRKESWERLRDENGEQIPLRAGVSSFGFGGVNAHILLEEYISSEEVSNAVAPYIFVLSAKTKKGLKSQVEQLREYIDENDEVDLSRLAYTLQVGRDGMNFRFACIANSVTSLKKNLLDFSSESESSSSIYINELSSHKDLALLFGNDEDFSETVAAWVNKRKLDKLANLWVKGVPVDWTRLYSVLPKRMSLPSYPFEKGNYWKIPLVSGPAGLGLSTNSGSNVERMAGSLIGPVIHKNISDVSGLKFSSVFTGKETFLADHVIMGEKILPAVVYVEMANIAVRTATDCDNKLSTTIENIVFLEPLVIGNKSACVQTSISVVASSKVNFEISSIILGSEESSRRRVHAQGTLTIGVLDDSDSIDSQSIFGRTDVISLDVDRYYDQLGASGLQYGLAHRAIKKMNVIDDDVRAVVGKLELPSSVTGTSSRYTLHPSLMDAALQIAGAIDAGDNSAAVLKLPFAIERVEIYRAVNTSVDVVARPIGVISSEVRKYDIDIYLESGELAVSVAGFSTRILHPAKESKTIDRIATSKSQQENNEGRISDIVPGELQEELNDILRRSISDHLNIDLALVDVDTELSEFGFDSVTLTGFGNVLNQEYGFELTPTTFFEFPTVGLLSAHLLSEYPDNVMQYLTIPEPKVTGFDSDATKPGAHSESAKKFDSDSRSQTWANVGFLNSPFCTDNSIGQKALSKTMAEAIAIVGVSGAFPEAGNIDQFWENISNGRDSITEMPNERWDWENIYGDPSKDVNKTNIKSVGVLEGIDEFDPLFFGISPKEAVTIDPQQRILMTYVWKVIEDAGYAPSSLSGTNTGVFMGTGTSGYGSLLAQAGVPIEGYSAAGMVGSVGPNRISFLLNLHGPSEPIETACSSSLVAIHRAVSAMQLGQCDQAIVGGVNLLVTPEAHISFTKAGMLSIDGKCKSFSSSANGYVRGEGVGMLFLKRLSDAEKEGDQIYGVIRGSAENHGGRSNSLTAPNPKAQASVIQSAIEQSGIDHTSITYVEAHGTGTPLGDPVEIQGLKTAFNSAQDLYDAPFCGVGSVKTNIGHLELAAGVAGVIKVLLQMKHKTLAPSLHCDQENEFINLEGSPFYFVKEPSSWDCIHDGEGNVLPRRAGVSSFGFGGVNAHVILEEYIETPQLIPEVGIDKHDASVILLSAKNKTSLQRGVKALYLFLLGNKDECDIESLAYTLQVGRDAMSERVAIVADSIASLIRMLKGYLEDGPSYSGVFEGGADTNSEAISMFSGDTELLEAVDKWISLGKWKRLAELWAKGLKFDWSKIYADRSMRRMHLPTYEFSHDSYWVGAPSVVDVPDFSSLHNGPENRPEQAVGKYRVSLDRRIMNRLNSVVCDLTNIPIEQILPTESLESYGMDSIVISKFDDILSAEFPGISKTFFYENKTLEDISKRLLSEHESQCLAWVNNEKVQPGIDVVDDLGCKSKRQVLKHDDGESLSKLRASQRELWQKCIEEEEEVMREPIAIIGIDGRYPGAENVEEFWLNIKQGVDSITEIPEERWPIENFYDEDRQECVGRGKSYSKWGGFLKNVADFDPLFFNITPQLARDIDPQERIFLQTCWNTIEDAGYNRERLERQHENRVGVFAGVTTSSFSLYGPDLWQRGERSFPISSFGSVANRVSYTFNFNGPSMPVDTMCSASLTAIHEACEHIYRGDCELALAGGVNLFLHPSSYVILCGQQMLSPDGQCKSFGEGGNGFVPGEGVGAVLLKRLSQAERDGDHIYGVVRGTSVNHGGRTSGYTVPNPNAQTELVKTALSRAEVHPREVSYIEAHGTGTALGDPIEVTGLTNAFREQTQDVNFCKLGSVKSNIGHAESAAGIAGLTKVLMQMKYGELAPSLHSASLNENIEFSSTPFTVQQKNTEWKRPLVDFGCGDKVLRPRIAGISSFGAGGVNAHVIVEEYIAPPLQPEVRNPKLEKQGDAGIPVVLSAKSELQLKEYAQKLLEHIESNDIEFESLVYTLQVGREAMEHRLGFVASNISSLSEKLQNFVRGEELGLEPSSIRNKKLDSWVRGGRVDWHSQWSNYRPKTVSLPTYPFLSDRYWIPIIDGDANYSWVTNQGVDIQDGVNVKIGKNETSVLGKISDDKSKSVLDRVLAVMSNVTGIDLASISPDDPIENYGIDSIVVNQMNHSFENMFDEYSNTIMYENFSLRSVANQIERINCIVRDGENLGAELLTPVWTPSPIARKDVDHKSHIIILVGFDKENEEKIYNYFIGEETPKVVCLCAESGGIGTSYTSYAMQILCYLQQISAQSSKGITRIQLVISSEQKNSILCGLSSLLKTAAIENGRILSQLLLVQDKMSASEVVNIIENETLSDDEEVRYINGERSRKTLAGVPGFRGLEKGVWEDGGVYLISGGAGALGLKFAEYISSKVVSPIIVLIGRTEPSESSLRAIEAMELSGAWVEYRAADVSDEEAVVDLVDEIVQQYGELSGVIHAAGVINDGLIINKTETSFGSVLSPKVSGIISLDEATRDHNLKFFLSLASFSGVFGNKGQGDYSVANAFLDGYSIYRNELVSLGERQGHTIAVDWPLWNSEGMQVDPAIKELQWEVAGLLPLDAEEAFVCLEHALSSALSQVVVLYGDKKRIKDTFSISESRESKHADDFDANKQNLLAVEDA